MAADEIAVTSAGPVLGEIVCRGRLMDREGRRVAGFRQTTRVWRGSRVIELLIELDIDRQPGANPWDSYYAARFAWKDETAELSTAASNLANVPTELDADRIAAFLDIRRGKQRTTLLCGGLPYHRRLGLRKLDTLLVVQGETARSFRLGIGIDVPHPLAAALGFLAPPLVLADQPPPPTPTGWLFHLDCRNVLATHWEAACARTSAACGHRCRHAERADAPGQSAFASACWKPTAAACSCGCAVSAPSPPPRRSTPATCRRCELAVGRRPHRHPDRPAPMDRGGGQFDPQIAAIGGSRPMRMSQSGAPVDHNEPDFN